MLLLAGEATIWQLIFWEENIGWLDGCLGIEHRDVVIVLAGGQRDSEGGRSFWLKAFLTKEGGGVLRR